MITESVIVRNKTGLHARPATMIVKLAGQYVSTIELIYNDKTIKGKSLMSMLSAGIKGGAEVIIRCDGADEQAAIDELKTLFNDGFGEL